MKKWILSVGVFALTACTSTAAMTGSPSEAGMAAPSEEEPPAASSEDTGAIVPAAQPPDLPNMGPAPELENEVWLNVDEPLRLADLRGSVVALDMWTFG
jgi:hypothetical protein